MSDFPVPSFGGLAFIHTWSLECLARPLSTIFTVAKVFPAEVSTTLGAANLIVYLPFSIASPTTIKKVFWYNGATVAGNIEVGVYDSSGRKIFGSSATAQTTVNVVQVVDSTDTLLGPGDYYMALTSTNATSTFFAVSVAAAGIARCMGIKTEAGAGGLPATATFANTATLPIPTFGLALRTGV